MIKEIKAYLKYDNHYWNKERKTILKKRLFICSIVSAILINAYSIYKKHSPWKTVGYLADVGKQNIEEIFKDFPNRTIAQIKLIMAENYNLNEKDIISYLDNLYTSKTIQNLIKKDNKIKDSEVGGLVFLMKSNNSEKYLDFIDIKSKNSELSKKIIANKNNINNLEKLIISEKDEFEDLLGERLYKNIINKIKNEKRRKFFTNNLISNYLDNSDKMYVLDYDDLIKQLYPGNYSGRFIGVFHIHNQGRPPSRRDIELSRKIREFVISDKKKGYIFYQLKKGKITAEIKKNF